MTSFEKLLIKKGYIKFTINCKTMKYEIADRHIISSMVNLDHRYIHKTDKIVLEKIKQGKSIMDKDFTTEDRKNIICFGLHEGDKPPTLIFPRPKIRVKRKRVILNKERIVIENEAFDDSMNIVLKNFPPEKVFQSLFDKSISFSYDLTI